MIRMFRAAAVFSAALMAVVGAFFTTTSFARPANPVEAADALAITRYIGDHSGVFAGASNLVTGRHDAILIDTQSGAADAEKLVKLIRESGKRLTTIYISHGDPDYYFGTARVQDAFPGVRIVASAPTVAHIKATQADKLAFWGSKMGADRPARIIFPEVLESDTLMLEGESLNIIGLDGPTPDRSVVWIPSLRTVLGGIPVFGGEHVWMADTQSAQSHADWLQTLAAIRRLKPQQVIPGHYTHGTALDVSAVDFTADYIRAFDQENARSRTAEALIASMKKRFPTLQGDSSLELSAKVAKGEIRWP